MTLLKAFFIARKAHKGQRDKGGKVYLLHPLHVMRTVKGRKAKTVALLHDVVEDSDYTFEMLENHFDSDVIEALRCMTKTKGMPYDEYIQKIKENDIARRVKLADLHHNMDLSRLKEVTKKDKERIKKYKRAVNILEK